MLRPAQARSKTPRTEEASARNGHPSRPSPTGNHARRPARGARVDELDHDDRPQADRDHVHGHDVRVLLPRRRRGAADAPAAGRAEQHADLAAGLQPAVHDARDDDDLPVRRADDGRPRELLRAVDDRRARHGLPAAERALLLAAARRRHRLLRLGLLEPAGSRLDELPAAVERRLHAGRRPGRVDLPDPPDRHLLDPRRRQLLRDDREHAREGHELGPPAAVHLGDPDVLGADHLRDARDRGGRDDAA